MTNEQAIQEIWGLFRETREQMKETDRRMRETERILKEQSQETERILKEQSQETDRKMRETDKRIEKANKEVNKKLGELVNRWGEFVEYFVAPSILKLFQEIGIPVQNISQRSKGVIDGETLEMDIVAVNGDSVIVVEVKSNLKNDDVDDFLEDLDKFKKFFPIYENKRVIGCITGMVMTKQVSRYAYKKGLYVLGQSGEVMTILNDKKFKPREW